MIGNGSGRVDEVELQEKYSTGDKGTSIAEVVVDNEDDANEDSNPKVQPNNQESKTLTHQQSSAAPARIQNLYATVYSFNMFTITDGAIRLIVLLHAATLGFTAIQIAFMFVLYELAGVFTNLFGGIAAVRYGLRQTLFLSLFLQIIGLVLLILVNPIFGDLTPERIPEVGTSVTVYITFCQMLSGVSKDFMKISCKTIPKLVTKSSAETDGALFKLVAWVTGLKNSFKGFGTLLGAVLVNFLGFEIAIGVLLVCIVLIFPAPIILMDHDIGKGDRKSAKFFTLENFKKTGNINVLSFARFFLFGSRDVWFEIATPIFIRQILQLPDWTVGLFMGGYIIIYGNLQTFSSTLYRQQVPQEDPETGKTESAPKKKGCAVCFSGPPTSKSVPTWAWANTMQLFIWSWIMYPLYVKYDNAPVDSSIENDWRVALSAVFVTGLILFAFFFAVNSAVHSYLIVVYSKKDKAAMDLGFYYMANAMGRLVGTMLSGIIYQFTYEDFGLSMNLWVSTAFMVGAAIIGYKLKEN